MARGFRKCNLILALTMALGVAAINGAVAQSGGGRPIGTVSSAKPRPPAPRGSEAIFSGSLQTQTPVKPLANETLHFYLVKSGLRPIWIGTATTDASGGASVSYLVPATATPGNYKLTVKFAGEGDYLASIGQTTVSIR